MDEIGQLVGLAVFVILLLRKTKTDVVGLCALCHRGRGAYWKGDHLYQWCKKTARKQRSGIMGHAAYQSLA